MRAVKRRRCDKQCRGHYSHLSQPSLGGASSRRTDNRREILDQNLNCLNYTSIHIVKTSWRSSEHQWVQPHLTSNPLTPRRLWVSGITYKCKTNKGDRHLQKRVFHPLHLHHSLISDLLTFWRVFTDSSRTRGWRGARLSQDPYLSTPSTATTTGVQQHKSACELLCVDQNTAATVKPGRHPSMSCSTTVTPASLWQHYGINKRSLLKVK